MRRIQMDGATTFWSRFLGLMGKTKVDRPLWFPRCRSLHSFFMKMPIEVIGLANITQDKEKIRAMVVSQTVLLPWRTLVLSPHVDSVLECPVGYFEQAGFSVGQRCTITLTKRPYLFYQPFSKREGYLTYEEDHSEG